MRTISLLIFNFIIASYLIAQDNSNIVIYDDSNFGGAFLTVNWNWQAKDQQSIWDNKISAIRIPEGTTVIIYENSDYSGAHKVLSKDWQAIDEDENWDNEISAIRFFDASDPYSMIYHCYLQDGAKDLWSRTNDFILNDNGTAYFGANRILEAEIDTLDWSLTFRMDAGNSVNAKLIIEGDKIFGWVENSKGVKQNVYGILIDLYTDNHVPRVAQSVVNNMPVAKVDNKPKEVMASTIAFPLTNYSEGVKVYKTTNFTGESRYVDEDWSFGDVVQDDDFFEWWRQIKSIRVPAGWAIVCYSSENFSGNHIQITGDWVPAKSPGWDENIKSIRIIRRGIEDYWGNLLNPAVVVYKTTNFTGESRYVDKDWSFGDIVNDDDFFEWWRQIKSIRVPRGWAIVCYSGENFTGDSIQITGDWIPGNDPKWNENIRSIKIVRSGGY